MCLCFRPNEAEEVFSFVCVVLLLTETKQKRFKGWKQLKKKRTSVVIEKQNKQLERELMKDKT